MDKQEFEIKIAGYQTYIAEAKEDIKTTLAKISTQKSISQQIAQERLQLEKDYLHLSEFCKTWQVRKRRKVI